MAKTIFDHLKSITKDKVAWDSLSDDEKKSWDDYMITRWLSMNPEYVQFINELQVIRSGGVNSKDYYNMLLYALPKKYTYIKYTKKPKTFETKKNLLDFFGSVYKVSKRECLDIIEIFSILNLREEFDSIMFNYGLQDNEKEKLRKELFDAT